MGIYQWTDSRFGSVLTAQFTVVPSNFFARIVGRMVAVEWPGGPFQAPRQLEAVDAGVTCK